ncbi:M48 family metallopeptidase [Wenzhouxiangella sp. AB-CW3]|uniref:M48 family metallopeptidase n=1 Tax=Wenzhouxiangella sp. AB-CW3 TaxID=2771012 RepID=UPI00168AD003|nr:M48 family metallopeptidase [Wenzhouxiangella sp. AB-CW3]QOC21789.1 M48 family metallopeptidase [Wenzhouxiangella sp. AB-CW3]
MEAFYQDGLSSRRHPVRVARFGDVVRVTGQDLDLEYRADEIHVPTRLGDSARSLELPDGGLIFSEDNEAIDALFPGSSGLERLVHRLEQHWGAALGAVVVTALASVLFFTHAVPWVGDQAAKRLPMEAEHLLGQQVPTILELMGMRESELPHATRNRLQAAFNELLSALPENRDYELRFARWGDMPNALALPGGVVIVTDGLVELFEEDRLTVAVMAHEIGHLEHRHTMRSVAQSASVFVVLSLALGDLSGVTALTAGVPTFLANNHYSRDFEREADAFALELLKHTGNSPEDFAEALERLVDDKDRARESEFHYLSSHPPTQERIDQARASGSDY